MGSHGLFGLIAVIVRHTTSPPPASPSPLLRVISLCVWALLGALLWSPWGYEARGDDLRTVGELESLCAFSPPLELSSALIPGGAALSDPLLLSASRRSYLFERVARLFGVHTVEVSTRTLSLTKATPSATPHPADPSAPHEEVALDLDVSAPIALLQSAFALTLGDAPLRFDGLTPHAVERVLLAHRAGLLALEIDFALDDTRSGLYCERVDDQRLVHALALQARLKHTGSQEVVAIADTAAAASQRARFSPDTTSFTYPRALALRPRVEVTRIECLDVEPPDPHPTDPAAPTPTAPTPATPLPALYTPDCLPSAALQWLQDEIELQLLECYAAALRAHGRTQGALSLRLHLLLPSGTLDSPLISIDALASDPISTCTLSSLSTLSLPPSLSLALTRQTPTLPSRALGLVVIFRPTKR
jgi:hypothetical protein